MTKSTHTPWLRVAWVPSFAAVLWCLVAAVSFHYNLGGDAIPLDTVISMVFAELVMVIAGLGVLAFFRLAVRTPLNYWVLGLNLGILISAALIGLTLFLGL